MMDRHLQPLVSILITNYNYASFVSATIESALQQDYPNCEVIVVDDGSTDNSKTVLSSYRKQINCIFQDNGGQSAALNRAFSASQGEIICLLDADDLYCTTKVSAIVQLLQRLPDLDWCFHLSKMMDLNGRRIESQVQTQYESGIWDYRACIKQGKSLPFCPCTTSSLCFRRTFFESLAPIPEVIKITSDNYLKLAASMTGKGFLLNQELAIQKIHGNNAYTLRNDKPELKAEVMISIAYGMYLRFPQRPSISTNLMAMGLSTHWRIGQMSPDLQTLCQNYNTSIGWFKFAKIRVLAVYFLIKEYCKQCTQTSQFRKSPPKYPSFAKYSTSFFRKVF